MYSTLEDIQTGMQDSLFSDDQINLRSEQRDAIDHAKEHFCKRSGRKGEYQYAVLTEYRQYLWNAKMRFGKTICAMQLMRELNVKRTLIITHRPVVGDSWLEAFGQVVGTKIQLKKYKAIQTYTKHMILVSVQIMRTKEKTSMTWKNLLRQKAIIMLSSFQCSIYVSQSWSTPILKQKIKTSKEIPQDILLPMRTKN